MYIIWIKTRASNLWKRKYSMIVLSTAIIHMHQFMFALLTPFHLKAAGKLHVQIPSFTNQ